MNTTCQINACVKKLMYDFGLSEKAIENLYTNVNFIMHHNLFICQYIYLYINYNNLQKKLF